MRVLMLGWEFPPFKSGGLGTACQDLTKGLLAIGVDVTFVMPRAPDCTEVDGVRIIGTDKYATKFKTRRVKTSLKPYQTAEAYDEWHRKSQAQHKTGAVYGPNLYEEIKRYTYAIAEIAEEESFDIIHAHDWMTYQAGIIVKKLTGKPLVVHLHASEFDRTGGNPNQYISHLEWQGLMAADRVITISNYMRKNIMDRYLIPTEKIHVVHWGIDAKQPLPTAGAWPHKTVLFLGRLTIQKGPDYFLAAAKLVLAKEPGTFFIMVGDGDMFPRIVNEVLAAGLSHRFLFTGFLKGPDVYRAYQMADVYVMPSVSEPFGLVALESLQAGTPVILSKTSGVSEVVTHALKVDFWDVEEMANKILGVLRYAPLHDDLKENGLYEVKRMNLITPAKKVEAVYHELFQRGL